MTVREPPGSRRSIVLAFVAVAAATAASLQATGEPYARQKELDKIEKAIAKGKWTTALRQCDRTSASIGSSRSEAPNPPAFFAELLARCAVAAFHDGDAVHASWLRHSAHIFDSAVAAAAVSRLGTGIALPPIRSATRYAYEPGPYGALYPLRTPGDELFEGAPPMKIRTPPPDPGRLLQFGTKAKFSVEVVIGLDGKVREPVLRANEGCTPSQAFEILRTFEGWSYEPARRAGGPVEIAYELTIQFGSRG